MDSAKVKRVSGSIIVEITSDDGQTKEEYFRGVRCGLAWPTAVSPGYFVLIGQYTKSNITGRFPLRFLREGQGETPAKLFQKLFNETGARRITAMFRPSSKRGEQVEISKI